MKERTEQIEKWRLDIHTKELNFQAKQLAWNLKRPAPTKRERQDVLTWAEVKATNLDGGSLS